MNGFYEDRKMQFRQRAAARKQSILERIRSMSTDQLLKSTIHDSGGDDYDGCFTDHGLWEFEAEEYELRARLWIIGAIEWTKRVEDWKR